MSLQPTPTIPPLQRYLNAAIADQQLATLRTKAAALAGSRCGFQPAPAAAPIIPPAIARLQQRADRLRAKLPPLGMKYQDLGYAVAFTDPAWWVSRRAIAPTPAPDLAHAIMREIVRCEQQIRAIQRAQHPTARRPINPRCVALTVLR